MKKLIFIVMACYGLNAGAQERQSKNFIYLFSDSVIHAENIRVRPDILGYFQLRADSKRFPLAQVKFFSNEDGFFANTRKINFNGDNSFSERMIEGKINLFQQISYEPSVYDREFNHGYRHRSRRSLAVDSRMYYNKGFGDLKKVNYNNLKRDMADDMQSMRMLEIYRKSKKTTTILYVAAGASIAGALIAMVVGGLRDVNNVGKGSGFGTHNSGVNLKDSNMTPSYILLGVGVGTAIWGYSLDRNSARNLESAFDTYNR